MLTFNNLEGTISRHVRVPTRLVSLDLAVHQRPSSPRPGEPRSPSTVGCLQAAQQAPAVKWLRPHVLDRAGTHGPPVPSPGSSQRKNSALDSLAAYMVWGYWKLKRKSRLICPIRIKISVTAVLRRRQPCPFTIMYVWIVMPRSKKCSHCLSTTSKKSCARNVAASTLSKRQLLSSQ